MKTSVRLMGLVGLVALTIALPATAATMELQLAASNIAGLSDGTSMWGHPWLDASGHGRDANPAQSYWSPQYEVGETGIFNGEDYLYFSNSDSVSGAASLSGWGFTSMVVANFDTTATVNRTIMSFNDADDSAQYLTFQMLTSGNLQVVYHGSSWQQHILATTGQDFRNEDHLFVVDYRGANDINVYVDGVAVSLTDSSTGTVSITLTGIDTYRLRTGGDHSYDTNIAEARYYSGTWATGELEGVMGDLVSTYIDVPEPASLTMLALLAAPLLRRRRA